MVFGEYLSTQAFIGMTGIVCTQSLLVASNLSVNERENGRKPKIL
jgi:hypothetical protein